MLVGHCCRWRQVAAYILALDISKPSFKPGKTTIIFILRIQYHRLVLSTKLWSNGRSNLWQSGKESCCLSYQHNYNIFRAIKYCIQRSILRTRKQLDSAEQWKTRTTSKNIWNNIDNISKKSIIYNIEFHFHKYFGTLVAKSSFLSILETIILLNTSKFICNFIIIAVTK